MLYIFEEISKFNEDDFLNCLPLISQERLRKIEEYKFIKDKKLSLLVYLLLRIALFSEYRFLDKPEFEYGNNSKPRLKNNKNIEFNLSHCNCGVACALSRYEVGVDIQEYVSFEKDIGLLVLSDSENNKVINSTSPDKCFTLLWTLKESYGKYLAKGIAYDLKSTCFFTENKSHSFQYRECLFNIIEEEHYVLSICSKEKLECRKLSYMDLKHTITRLCCGEGCIPDSVQTPNTGGNEAKY